MKKIIDHIPLITGCLIYFGFCNLYYYYKEFKIDIYNYISNTEILLSFLPTIVITITGLYAYVYQLILDKAKVPPQTITKNIIEDENKDGELNKKSKSLSIILSSIPVMISLLYLLKYIIEFLLTKIFEIKEYQFQESNLLFAIALCLLIYFAGNLYKKPELISENFTLIAIFLIIYYCRPR